MNVSENLTCNAQSCFSSQVGHSNTIWTLNNTITMNINKPHEDQERSTPRSNTLHITHETTKKNIPAPHEMISDALPTQPPTQPCRSTMRPDENDAHTRLHFNANQAGAVAECNAFPTLADTAVGPCPPLTMQTVDGKSIS